MLIHQRQWLPGVFFVAIAATTQPLRGQEQVESILKKPTLSAADRGVLEAEVSNRVKSFIARSAGPQASEARDKLSKPAKAKEASNAGVETWVELVAGELDHPVAEGEFDTALASVIVLEELDHPKAIDTLTTGLHSKHAGVRYAAARALGQLRSRIKDDPAACQRAAGALGQAGAVERDELVLRRIYLSLNFKAAAPDFKLDDQAAAGLNEVLAGRAQRLKAGSRDEYKDEECLAAATACYPGASVTRQAAMVESLYLILQATVDHFLEPDTAPEAQPAMARLAQRIERTLHDMIRLSKATPPSKLVSDLLKSPGSDRQKLDKEVRAGLEELRGVLRGDPWKLP